MAHTTRSTRAVAITVKAPADADFVTGPHVFRLGFCAHIQVGIPMMPTLPARDSGTMPMLIARSRISAIACCANTRGSGGAAGPAGEVAGEKRVLLDWAGRTAEAFRSARDRAAADRVDRVKIFAEDTLLVGAEFSHRVRAPFAASRPACGWR